jgi:RNA polymerase sigma factor (sigma-70 family)
MGGGKRLACREDGRPGRLRRAGDAVPRPAVRSGDADDEEPTNTFINTYRAAQRRPEQSELDDVEELYLYRRIGGLEAASLGRSAEDELMDLFTDTQVKDAIDALPEQFRLAVLLADVDGFSYKEIAEILDVPIGTVMSRLHRGRKSLQKSLHSFALERGVIRAVPMAVADNEPTEPEEAQT